ncbi:MAG: 30S ribosomal protein S5 [Candidatus Yanofskybacteria bacterium]|nr:30S ribosomal protein S5 [Candidatus Yanofskybacteria bacterium]
MEEQKNNKKTGGRRGFGRDRGTPKEKSEFDSKVLDIARVTRVTKGGKRFSFRATIAIGDGKGRVGVGVAQGHDVAQSMQKATHQARKNMVTVPIKNGTIPHIIEYKYGSAVVLLKPAPVGNGVKAGGAVRVVAKLSGIENISAKLIKRTGNKINIARATIGALSKLKN